MDSKLEKVAKEILKEWKKKGYKPHRVRLAENIGYSKEDLEKIMWQAAKWSADCELKTAEILLGLK